MATVVVVSEDAEVRGWAARDLAAVGHQVVDASRVEHALHLLEQFSVDAVILDAALPHDGARTLTSRLGIHAVRLPIVTVAATDAEPAVPNPTGSAAETVVSRGRRDGALALAVSRAMDADCGFSGTLHSVSLLDMLQLMHISRRSLRIGVIADGKGSIDLVDGEVIDARHGSLEGVAALAAILSKSKGVLETSPPTRRARTIDRPFEVLLLDVLRQIDEGVSPESVASRRTTRPPPRRPGSLFPSSAVREAPAPRAAGPTPRLDAVESACRKLVLADGRAVGCGLLDVGTGLLVGYVSDQAWDDAWMLAQRAAVLLRAAQSSDPTGGDAASPTLTEFVLTNGRSRQFSRAIQGGSAAVVLLMPRTASVEAGWSALGVAQDALEHAAH